MRYLSVLALLLGVTPVAAQQPSLAGVDSIFRAFDRGDSPGCVLGVYRDGVMAYARGYGMANLELGVPLTPRSVFDIGSTSKQFTAASIVLLSQDGLLSLDDDIRKWLPELLDYRKRITIRHLLTHTSGLRDYIGLMTLAGADYDDVTTDAEALGVIVRQKALNFQPGEEYLYSNSGYFLAAQIVKRASGRSIRDFAAERIFKPLGMSHTQYRDDHTSIVLERATGYSPRDSGGYYIDVSNWEQLGDGGVFTTVEDLLQWDRNFYLPTVGGASLIKALQTTARLNSGKPITYALGLQRSSYRGVESVSHGGSWGGYRAELFRLPSLHFSAAVLCNVSTGGPSRAARRVADAMLGNQLQPLPVTMPPAADASPPVAISSERLRDWAGSYRAATGEVRAFETDGKRLTLITEGGRYPLDALDPTRFVLTAWGDPIYYELQPASRGGKRQVRETDGGEILDLAPLTLVRPSTAELQHYGGRYYALELDATVTISAAADSLTFQRPRSAAVTMSPLERDEFSSDDFTLRFQRRAGKVNGFLLDMGRTRALQFTRVGN